VDLLAHPLAERAVDQLVTLNAVLALEGPGHHQGLEVLTVADHLDALAREPVKDALSHAFARDHGRFQFRNL